MQRDPGHPHGDEVATRAPVSTPEARAGWTVERLAGAPEIRARPIHKGARLEVGAWLETDAHSRARVAVADIGEIEVFPQTRLRLKATGPDEHRLELARGTIRAVVTAPPRLFLVDTPSAVAVDLGCAYTLDVGDDGTGLLKVSAGWVAFEAGGRQAVVPAGARCETRPGVGPGTPCFEDADPALQGALHQLDFGGASATAPQERVLQTVLEHAREKDTLTLWHLISRQDPTARARVLDRMLDLTSLPQDVTREAILRLDPDALDAWKDELDLTWW